MSGESAAVHVVKRDAERCAGFLGLDKTGSLQGGAEAHQLAEAVSLDHAVHLTVRPAEPEEHRLAAAAPRVGLLFEQGEKFVVVGERRYTFGEACLHGVISRSDVEQLGYVEKYVRKAAEALASIGEPVSGAA